MKKQTCLLSALLPCLLATSVGAHAQVRFLAHGHTDLSINYDPDTKAWDFHPGSDTLGVDFAPDEVILKVKPAAQSTVPADSHFAFLGKPGALVWILPKVQNEELLYLGYGGDGIPTNVFVGDQVIVMLKNVTGPGYFFSYDFDAFGNPKRLFDSSDGISTNDVATVHAGGDYHLNWAFSQPGVYKVALEVSGTLLAGNQTTSSGPVTFTFAVGDGPKTLSTGHTDLSLVYTPETDAWDVHVGSDALMEEFDADDTILLVKPEARTAVPSDTKFSFLGNPGDPIWILPKVQNESLLYLGYGGDGIPTNVFVGDQVTVTLKNVTGPGNFFCYDFDVFGNPVRLFSTLDGITTADSVNVHSGGDAHLNWAFTGAGTYTVTLEITATLAEGNKAVSSGPVTYTFVVQTVLTVQHTDLQAAYDPTNLLQLLAFDVNDTAAYKSNEVNLIVAEAAKLPLPDGTQLGPGGSSLWILPASQDPNLLYLGASAESPSSAGRPGIPSGVFDGNLTLRLISVEGPGQFIVWQTPAGIYDFIFDTRDGVTDADSHTVIQGSHEHFNWGFTTNGVYHIAFQISGQLAGSTNIASPITPFTFNVLPLPTNAPPASIQLGDARSASGGGFTFSVTGVLNATIDVQSSDDLKEWVPVLPNVLLNTSPQTISIPADITKRQRFFRVLAH